MIGWTTNDIGALNSHKNFSLYKCSIVDLLKFIFALFVSGDEGWEIMATDGGSCRETRGDCGAGDYGSL